MHHLKEAEIHNELTGVLKNLIVLNIQIKMSIFWPFRYPGQGSQACTISKQLNFKIPLLPKLNGFRKIHKVHFYLFLA